MEDNLQVNFRLKTTTSILIGAYIFIAAYYIKNTINSFLIDDSTASMLSVEIVEILIIAILFTTFLIATLTLYIAGKKSAKKLDYVLYNKQTTSAVTKYFVCFGFIFLVIISLFYLNFINYVTPVFLILYGAFLYLIKNKQRNNLLIISGVAILFATMCFLIPTYWYASLCILSIAHITYGAIITPTENKTIS